MKNCLCVNSTEDIQHKLYIYLNVTKINIFPLRFRLQDNDTSFTLLYPHLLSIRYELQCKIVYLYRIAEYYIRLF